MSEENEEPSYCPLCADGENNIIGKTALGYWVLNCKDCHKDFLIKDVTGKIQIEIKVSA